MFDPQSIGVVSGKTTVEIDNEQHVVTCFDLGAYTPDNKTKITQRKLLETRTDGGVTLEADLRGSFFTWSRRT